MKPSHPSRCYLTDAQRRAIIRLRGQGFGVPTVAKKTGVNKNAVYNFVKREGIARDRSTANRLKMAKLGRKGRQQNIAKARAKRLENLRAASHDPDSNNPAVGTGYHLVAEMMQEVGAAVRRQVPIGPYYIDLFMDDIAVEVEYNALCGFGTKTARFKHLAKLDLPLLVIVHDGVRGIFRHRAKLVALLDAARRDPPTGGQYRVIRSCLEKGTCCADADKLAAVSRANHSRNFTWSH